MYQRYYKKAVARLLGVSVDAVDLPFVEWSCYCKIYLDLVRCSDDFDRLVAAGPEECRRLFGYHPGETASSLQDHRAGDVQ